ncbi:ubiquitin-like-conjugating enzyme ATG3 [Pollicipes pollicipes]|uniref:ubiquitin-like-conjugating enzyme ATG3 n=1 Tax=Pollicipes pollicipes TaxID=41117 RepID=UPI00188583EF|nr:ubiquitin-like-conjugating enzyme ATG3 [Pollicipes pollicipes]XP_037090042.1 ubiquitin-like-conjugating enzyme ATG3 [Pollicipes pollicipes]XP_037090043.1 ubiquitin-like-conjugating enzyme ATG3 [Pollicipes pollicipes]
MAMQSVLNTVRRAALGVADQLIPLPGESCFRERGMLTPDEFVECGDQLVHSCPTWSWASGEAAHARPYLPADKQFLITRNVPCHRRCKQLDHDEAQERLIAPLDGEDEGWVDTHHFSTAAAGEERAARSMEAPSAPPPPAPAADDDDDGEDGEPGDMEEFEESALDDADDAVVRTVPVTSRAAAGAACAAADDADIVRTRTYHLNITYDRYYRTPRLWLQGFDENRQPLTAEQMYEDFSQDHAHKTITMEAHPHLVGPPQASIHPCKHADTMKRLVETAEEGGRQISVQKYLIVFLKFMQAIIPTIEYDFTQNIQL